MPALLVVLSMTAGAWGNEAAPDLSQILARYPVGDVMCDYTAVRQANDGPQTTERFVAGRGWTLLSIDGRTPTFEEVVDYETEASSGARALRSHPDDFSIAAVVSADDAVLESVDAGTLTYVFEPRLAEPPEDAPASAVLRGMLTIAAPELVPAGVVVELVESDSRGRASGRPGEQRESHTFRVDAGTGALLVESFEMVTNGRAFFIREVVSSLKVDFSDFNCRRAQAAN